jgi:hypothetical protein
MRPNSHMPPPDIDRGPVFRCLVTSDPRIPEAAFPFVRETLDRLLHARLPNLRIAYARGGINANVVQPLPFFD